MLVALGILAAVIWITTIYIFMRWINARSRQALEKDLAFKLLAAPWSDKHVESLLRQAPRSPTLLRQYVTNAVQRPDLSEALRRAELFGERVPGEPWSWITRINVLRALRRPAEADELLRAAHRRFRSDPDIALTWARDATRQGNPEEAVRRFTQVQTKFPAKLEGYLDGAGVLTKLGRFAEADRVLQVGISHCPKAWQLWSRAAAQAEQRGDLDDAIRRWEELRDRFPEQAAGFVGGSEALSRAGRAAEACDLLQQAVDFFPGNKDVRQAVTRAQGP